jgi:hypothetical protein
MRRQIKRLLSFERKKILTTPQTNIQGLLSTATFITAVLSLMVPDLAEHVSRTSKKRYAGVPNPIFVTDTPRTPY